MALFNFTNQQQLYDTILPAFQAMKAQLNARRPLWDKLSFAKKKAWVTSNKDPIMDLGWDTYKFLNDYFSKHLQDNYDSE